ncbi:Hypp6427 [Branchiostoma lanceolatum]|uniref:Hypp6427 protein n=1 Tax=Branchiostoma lanceolatum TaxID=7740 RepID=A0A8K0E9K0_BRALA|nr:Hypp6427 [Branchiostoma lanceolatum]
MDGGDLGRRSCCGLSRRSQIQHTTCGVVWRNVRVFGPEPSGPGFESPDATDAVPLGKALDTTFLTPPRCRNGSQGFDKSGLRRSEGAVRAQRGRSEGAARAQRGRSEGAARAQRGRSAIVV